MFTAYKSACVRARVDERTIRHLIYVDEHEPGGRALYQSHLDRRLAAQEAVRFHNLFAIRESNRRQTCSCLCFNARACLCIDCVRLSVLPGVQSVLQEPAQLLISMADKCLARPFQFAQISAILIFAITAGFFVVPLQMELKIGKVKRRVHTLGTLGKLRSRLHLSIACPPQLNSSEP